MTRAKRGGLRRNALISALAWNHPQLESLVEFCLEDSDPVIVATAAGVSRWRQDSPRAQVLLSLPFHLALKTWRRFKTEDFEPGAKSVKFELEASQQD